MNTSVQVSSQELKHHWCLPDMKIKNVVKMKVIQISSRTKNPRNEMGNCTIGPITKKIKTNPRKNSEITNIQVLTFNKS